MRRIITSDDGAGEPGPTGPRRPPSAGPRLVVGFTGAAVVVAGLSLLAHEAGLEGVRPERDAPAAVVEAPKPFVPSVGLAVRPALPAAIAAPRFRLDDPEAGEPARSEGARIDPGTGRREEGFGRGAFTVIETPHLRLFVGDRDRSDPARSLFVTLARRAADGPGLSVIRTGERGRVETRFGAVETLEATFSGPIDRVCTGFAGSAGDGVRFDGWLCAPLGQAPEPRAVACALDALVALAPHTPGFDGPHDPTCRPAPDTRTGSLPQGETRKNEAQLRRMSQARP